jgi:hypothetical protein
MVDKGGAMVICIDGSMGGGWCMRYCKYFLHCIERGDPFGYMGGCGLFANFATR